MKQFQTFFLIVFSICILISCTGNTTASAGKDSTTNPSSITSTSASPGSGDDMYYELTTASAGKKFTMNGVTKMFVSAKGDMRVEMNFTNSLSGKSSAPMVIIGHSNKPNESISIDGSAKTYSVNHIDPDDIKTGEKIQSNAEKIGEEKIMGFNCVHVKIVSTKTLGSFYSNTDTIDLWRSNEVPMQASVKDLMNKFQSRTGNFMYSPQTEDQLKQMRCEGFMVKMEMKSKDANMIMQLTKVNHTTFPENMFEIPAGYKEDKNGM